MSFPFFESFNFCLSLISSRLVLTGSIDPGFIPRSYDENADDCFSNVVDFDHLSNYDDDEPMKKCPFILSEAEESLESEESVLEEDYI